MATCLSLHKSRFFLFFSFLLILISLLSYNAVAEDWITEPIFMPEIPELLGQGGSVVALPEGYRALFINPAGFADENVSFYPASTTFWYHSQPFRFIPRLFGAASGAEKLNAYESEMLSGGVGSGFSTSVAYVGKGLGLGLLLVADSIVGGSTPDLVSGDALATLCLLGGYAWSFNFFGIDVKMGGAFKPMFRFHAPLDNAEALNVVQAFASGTNIISALSSAYVNYGMGIGVDVGVTASWGPLHWGLALYDVGGSYFFYNQSTMYNIFDSLQRGHGLPAGSKSPGLYLIPMNVSTGLAYVPDMGEVSSVFQPSFHLDLVDTVGIISQEKSFWLLFHLGTELRLFNNFFVRAGLNQGHFTFGGGFKFYFFNLNFAYYTYELGQQVGSNPRSGCSIQADLKF